MKIPVTRAREEASKRGDFRFLYTSPNTNPSTQTFFQKTPTFFCFSPTFFHFSRRKTKKIATFSNGKKQGLMPFHQDSYLGYSIIRRKTRFFRKISTSICANQQNSIPLRCSIEKHGTYSPRKKRSFVQSSVLGLAQTPDFFALYYDNNGFCYKIQK